MTDTTPAAQAERMRNVLSFLLVGAFISVLPVFTLIAIPDSNRDLITYMVGQLSGMATTALGYYFVNKVGQDQMDETRANNTGKMADAIQAAIKTPMTTVMVEPGAVETANINVGPESGVTTEEPTEEPRNA